MVRHDGSELIPVLFDSHPKPSQLLTLQTFALEQVWWNAPIVVSQALLLSEIVRTYPAELAMFGRIYKRRKPNIAEILFFTIKYTSLLAVVVTIIVQLTGVPNSSMQCNALSWVSSILTFAICTLVVITLAWRNYIILHRSHRVLIALCVGLVIQLILTGWAVNNYYRTPVLLPNGLCAAIDVRVRSHKPAFWELSTFWYVLFNCLFDLVMVASSSYQLWRSARSPLGFARISALLFNNNIHYALCVDLSNMIELVAILAYRDVIPDYQFLNIAIQAMTGMQLLISEQNAVYNRQGTSAPTYNLPLLESRGLGSGCTAVGSSTSIVARKGPSVSAVAAVARKATVQKESDAEQMAGVSVSIAFDLSERSIHTPLPFSDRECDAERSMPPPPLPSKNGESTNDTIPSSTKGPTNLSSNATAIGNRCSKRLFTPDSSRSDVSLLRTGGMDGRKNEQGVMINSTRTTQTIDFSHSTSTLSAYDVDNDASESYCSRSMLHHAQDVSPSVPLSLPAGTPPGRTISSAQEANGPPNSSPSRPPLRSHTPIPYLPPLLTGHPYQQRPRTASSTASSSISPSYTRPQTASSSVATAHATEGVDIEYEEVDEESETESRRAGRATGTSAATAAAGRGEDEDAETSMSSRFSADEPHLRNKGSLASMGGKVPAPFKGVKGKLDSLRGRS